MLQKKEIQPIQLQAMEISNFVIHLLLQQFKFAYSIYCVVTGMPFNTHSQVQLRTNSLSHSTLTRPNVTFNYVNSKTNTSTIPVDCSLQRAVNFVKPLLSNINLPNRQTLPKMKKQKVGNEVLSHREHKRKKIFAKSQSNNDLVNVSYGTSTQNCRDLQENRWPTEMNEIRSRSSRRRNNIFQSYNPKSRISSQKHQLFKNETSKVLSTMTFDRPVHPRKLTNYLQLTPNRVPKRTDEESPVVKLSAQKYIQKIPLRDTYVAERDYQVNMLPLQQKESRNILQKVDYEIPIQKQQRSFAKKTEAEVFSVFTKSKNHFPNLQFEEESIIGYSQRQTHHHEEHIDDLPELLMQTNDRVMIKKQKSEHNKSKGQPSLVDINLLQTTVASDKSQTYSKQLNRPNEPSSKVVYSPVKKSALENIPYLLIALGILLFLIQLLK